MLALSRWKIILVLASVIFGLLFTLPNVLPDSVLAQWPGFLPHQRLNLGPRPAGRLLAALEVDTDALKKERLNDLAEEAQPGAARRADRVLRPRRRRTASVALQITDPTQIDAGGRRALEQGRRRGAERRARGDWSPTTPTSNIQIALRPRRRPAGRAQRGRPVHRDHPPAHRRSWAPRSRDHPPAGRGPDRHRGARRERPARS